MREAGPTDAGGMAAIHELAFDHPWSSDSFEALLSEPGAGALRAVRAAGLSTGISSSAGSATKASASAIMTARKPFMSLAPRPYSLPSRCVGVKGALDH